VERLVPRFSRRGAVTRPTSTSRRPDARLARLLDVLFLAGSQTGWTASRLAKRFGVSRRRLFEDLHFLNVCGFRIVSDRAGYRLLRGGAQLPCTLSAEEVLSLLRPAGGMEDVKRSAQAKLAGCLPPPLRDLFRSDGRVIAAVQSPPVPERLWAAIDRALAENRRLRMNYRGLGDWRIRARVVEPHALFMRGTGWYLAAWCVEEKAFRLFRLDRIASAAAMAERFEPRRDFDVHQYLDRTVGVWSGSVLAAKIEVLPSHVEAVRSEALARGLPFRTNGHAAVLEIPHGHPDETAWWLAQFGEGVRVMEPVSLRERLAALGRRIVKLNVAPAADRPDRKCNAALPPSPRRVSAGPDGLHGIDRDVDRGITRGRDLQFRPECSSVEQNEVDRPEGMKSLCQGLHSVSARKPEPDRR
jgi:predicted DNA-binding transcriptional regulator YafY